MPNVFGRVLIYYGAGAFPFALLVAAFGLEVSADRPAALVASIISLTASLAVMAAVLVVTNA